MQDEEPYHRAVVGGLWNELGQLQFDFLISHGLRPHHHLLDIGCGSLRAGVKLIPYLASEHYCGIDKDRDLIRSGEQVELTEDARRKKPVLMEMDNFDFARLERRFDFAIAHSVFTHLPVNQICRCLMRVEEVLKPGGMLYATFFENERGKRNLEPLQWETSDGFMLTTYFDRDPYHYDLGTFESICSGTSLQVSYIGDWNHPRRQRMLAFERRAF